MARHRYSLNNLLQFFESKQGAFILKHCYKRYRFLQTFVINRINMAFDTLFSFEKPFKDLFRLVINGDKLNVLQLSKVKHAHTCPWKFMKTSWKVFILIHLHWSIKFSTWHGLVCMQLWNIHGSITKTSALEAYSGSQKKGNDAHWETSISLVDMWFRFCTLQF